MHKLPVNTDPFLTLSQGIFDSNSLRKLQSEWPTFEKSLLEPSLSIVESLGVKGKKDSAWKKVKRYNNDGISVDVFRSTSQAHRSPDISEKPCRVEWVARISTHKELSYTQFKEGLFISHTEHESEYIPELIAYEKVYEIATDQAKIYSMRYKSPPLVKDRVFGELVFSEEYGDDESNGPRSFINVSIPVALPETSIGEGAVRACYISVEHVSELPDGSVQWIMATCSDAGGMVPQWITNKALPSRIAHDVPSFVTWAKGK